MTTPTSIPGRTIGGRYALLSSVGAGGMGTVWRAHDQLLRRDVAVKEVLLPAGVPRAERQMLCERTLREARAAAALNNPAVVRIYDVVEEDDRPWIVMELVAARSLADILSDSGPLPAHVVANVGLQVLGALEAAHSAGILHRDVKPGNVLLSTDGRATLTDFGVARSTGDSALTSTGLLLGSPAYIPPERARGRPAIPASDLWSLGATLYAAVEGRPPYDKGDPLQTLTAIVSDPPPPFTHAGPLRRVITGLLEKEPEHRWDVRRARDGFRDALGISRADVSGPLGGGVTRVLGPLAAPVGPGYPVRPPDRPAGPEQARWQDEPGRAMPPGGPVSPAGQRPRRRRRSWARIGLALAAIMALAGLATAGGYYIMREQNQAPKPPDASESAAPTAAPLVYIRFAHPDGFTVAIPKGWTKEVLSPSGIIQFRDPVDSAGGGRFVRLEVAPTDSTDIRKYWEARAASRGTLPGYQLVGIRNSTVGTRNGADWEFKHTLDDFRHVIDRGVIMDGKAYGIYLSTREDQFAASKHIIETVARSFALSG